MKKYEALYNWPIEQIQMLCDSEDAQVFNDSLEESSQSEFLRFTQEMDDIVDELIAAKTERRLFTKWRDVNELFLTFEKEFPSFPNFNPNRFRLSLLLELKLVDSWRYPTNDGEPEVDEEDIDENTFELQEVVGSLPISWLVFENVTSFSDSTVILSYDEIAKLEKDDIARSEKKDPIGKSVISPKLLLHLLATLHTTTDVQGSSVALVKRIPDTEPAAVIAFVKLLVLTTGTPVHLPQDYLVAPHVLDRDCIRAGTPFQQLDDVLYVLSEYNSRKEILTKYLALYHVIENFMFKFPIVTLEHQNSGRMFSMRDFRRLYRETEGDEVKALEKLLREVFDREPIAGKKFSRIVADRWNNLVTVGASTRGVEDVLEKLGIKERGQPISSQRASSYFARIVYKVRNAIVHNKETEFHLTDATLDQAMYDLIGMFLIPCLEEMCFDLIGQQNQLVWYQNDALKLY